MRPGRVLIGSQPRRGIWMKKSFLALLVAADAFAAAGTGGASTQSPQAAGRALLTCGKTRTIGLLASITAPPESIGELQVKGALYYVSSYNKSLNARIKLINNHTQ